MLRSRQRELSFALFLDSAWAVLTMLAVSLLPLVRRLRFRLCHHNDGRQLLKANKWNEKAFVRVSSFSEEVETNLDHRKSIISLHSVPGKKN